MSKTKLWHTVKVTAPEGMNVGVVSSDNGLLHVALKEPDTFLWPGNVHPIVSSMNTIAEGFTSYVVTEDDYPDCPQQLFDMYIRNVAGHVLCLRVDDHEPDERLMRMIEEHVNDGIPEQACDDFRRGLLAKMQAESLIGDYFYWDSEPHIKEALETITDNWRHKKPIRDSLANDKDL